MSRRYTAGSCWPARNRRMDGWMDGPQIMIHVWIKSNEKGMNGNDFEWRRLVVLWKYVITAGILISLMGSLLT